MVDPAEIRVFRVRINAAVEAEQTEYSQYDISKLTRSFLNLNMRDAVHHKENLAEAIAELVDIPDQAAIVERAKESKKKIIAFIARVQEKLTDQPSDEDTSPGPFQEGRGANKIRTAFKKKRVMDYEATTLTSMDTIVSELEGLSITNTTTDLDYRVVVERLATASKRAETIIKDGSSLTNDALDAQLPRAAEALETGIRRVKDAQAEADTRVNETKQRLGVFGDSQLKLTELKPPTFSGDHDSGADFFSFKKEYLEYSATKSASQAQQLRILLKTCLTGAAANLCMELTSVEAVLAALEGHYGCARVLLTSRIQDFKTLGACPTQSAAKKRTWLIPANHKLKSIKKLAADHGLLNNLYFSGLLSEVRLALPWKVEELYKERLKDSGTSCVDHEELFSAMIDFIEYLVEESSFDVKYELALGPRQTRGDDKKDPRRQDKPPDRSQPKKKTFTVVNLSDSDDSGADGSSMHDSKSHQTSRPVNKKKSHATSYQDGKPKSSGPPRSSPSKTPSDVTCPICKKDHKFLFQCEKFQSTRVKERMRLTKTTKACFRCLRMDSNVIMSDKDKWWETHKAGCDGEWTCEEEDCKKVRPARQWHFTMCVRHTRANKDREKDFLKSNKSLLKPTASLFFLQPLVYSLDPIAMQPRPDHSVGALVHEDVNEPYIFMLQRIVAPHNAQLLLFYDSGCSGSALNDHACSLLPHRQVTAGPTKLGVAGGRSIEVPGGDVQFYLDLAQHNEQATITGLQMPSVTTKFPFWNLQRAFDDLQDGYKASNPDGPALPDPPHDVGGKEVDVMLGIRYNKYFPIKKFMLPCGLSIYEGLFKSPGGQVGILGGTHKSWRNARDLSQHLSREIFFSSELTAYRVTVNTLHHVYHEIHHQDPEEEVRDLDLTLPTLRAVEGDEADSDGSCKELDCFEIISDDDLLSDEESTFAADPVRRGRSIFAKYHPAKSLLQESELFMNCPYDHCSAHKSSHWIVPDYWDLAPSLLTAKQDLEKFENLDRCGSEVTYRCLRCRNCNDCRRGDLIEQGSLEGEVQQALIEKCIRLNIKKKRLETSLPFIMDPHLNLAPNKHRATAMLKSQLNKVKRNPAIKEDIYKAHNKLLDKGHVCAIKDLSPEDKKIVMAPGATVNHIPWNIVMKISSMSTPARMTFNASSKTSTGHSLNSVLAKGENKLPKIFHILLKFGSKKAAFTADVSMAYNAVKLYPAYYNFQRYLWQPDLDVDGEYHEYVIKTIIYGVISSGNLTAAGFQLLADYLRDNIPSLVKGAEALENSYVDDTAHAEDTDEEVRFVAGAMETALDLASMSVKAFTFSGSQPSELVSVDGASVGLLGYVWWPLEDLVSIAVKELFFGKSVRGRLPEPVSGALDEALAQCFTRRTLVAKFASIFDPLGFATPVTARIKLDLSVITDLKLGWDDPIPDSYLSQWVMNLQDLQELRTLRFSRCYLDTAAISNEVELVVSVDASEKIAVACVHARSQLPDGSFACRFVAAKSKLVHMSTVPRGELKAAVLGASMAQIVKRNLGSRVKRTLFVTDSTIVMFWLNQDQRPLQTAVRNSVIEIRRLSHVEQWFHIDSKNNLADLGTRDAQHEDLVQGSEWQRGKWWMTLPIDDMPILSRDEVTLNQQERQEASKEVKASDICGITLPGLKDKVSERYSFSKYIVDPCVFSWPKSVRTLAFVFRFINNLKFAVRESRLKSGSVSPKTSKALETPSPSTGGLSAQSKKKKPRSPPIGVFSPPRTRSKVKLEDKVSASSVYTPKSFRGFKHSSPEEDPLPEAPAVADPRSVQRSLFMDDSGNVRLPNGYTALPGPVFDAPPANFTPPREDVAVCPDCDIPEVLEVVRQPSVSLQPSFPLNSPPPLPPHPTASNLRPQASEFSPPPSTFFFPNMSPVSKEKLLDFQLSPPEIEAAENYFFLKATKEVFQFVKPAEYKSCSVTKDGVLHFSGRILDGQEILDPEHVMSDLQPLSFVKPMCDRYSPVSYSCMIYSHHRLTHHRNSIATLRESRNLVYVMRGRDLANEIRENCSFCKRFRARLIEVEMGKLHQSRLTCAPAFYTAQVDLFGKYLASCEHNHRATVPVWGVIFKDPSSGAIAIYGMAKYSTGAFINAYTRHSSRYGHPLKLFVDAGSQLIKACKDMELSWIDLTSTLNSQFGVGIEHVVCTTGSHAAHGIVERSVLEVKRLLNVTYKGIKLDLYGYDTAFTFIANELNSLPLCLGSKYENLEHSDLITPSRLLLGRNNQRAPSGYPRLSSRSRQVDQLDSVHRAWWETWKTEKIVDYIPAPSKWHKNSRPPQVGDVVVFIRDEAVLGESLWKLGMIDSLIPSKADGLIRAVMVRYRNPSEQTTRTTKRDVRKMAVIYREGELDLMQILNEASKVNDIRCQVQLQHLTVHGVLLAGFLDSLRHHPEDVAPEDAAQQEEDPVQEVCVVPIL